MMTKDKGVFFRIVKAGDMLRSDREILSNFITMLAIIFIYLIVFSQQAYSTGLGHSVAGSGAIILANCISKKHKAYIHCFVLRPGPTILDIEGCTTNGIHLETISKWISDLE